MRKQNKIFAIIIILAAVLCLVWLTYAFITVFWGDYTNINARMFSTIEELKKLDPYVIKKLTVDDDHYAQNLDIEESYLCKVEYNDRTYEVYAYVFKNTSSAEKYFQNITGKNGTKQDANFSSSSDLLTRTRYVAYKNNCAFLVKGNGYNRSAEFINWLNADFSKGLFE